MIQKVFNNKKAFTLVETIIVIVIIGILMMGTTVYLGGTTEKRKIIEAQGCANTILGEMNNYAFYALTSKNLKINNTVIESPDFYRITLDKENSTLKLEWSRMHDNTETSTALFKTLSVNNTCHQNNSKLQFDRKGGENGSINISSLKMNKGFSPISLSENRVFYLIGNGQKYLTGDIIISLCLDDDCESTKQFAKWKFDGRIQKISLQSCAYYNENNSSICKTRDDCKVYKSDDPTACDQY